MATLEQTDISLRQLVLSRDVDELATVSVPTVSTYAIGTVLGRLTATGKMIAYTPGAVDGSQLPVAVLLETLANATGGTVDTDTRVLITGKVRAEFCRNYNAGTPIALTAVQLDLLRSYGIVVQTTRQLLKFDNS